MQGYYVGRSRAGVVGMVSSYEMDGLEFESRQEQDIFPSPKRPDSLWGPFSLLGVQWICRAAVMNECSYTSTPPPPQCLRAMGR